MKEMEMSPGCILYEKEREEQVREAVEAMARMRAESLSDKEAARVGVLFPEWEAGVEYQRDLRLSDRLGRLYRVVQTHVSQADWPVECTPSLYAPLGLDREDPEAVPEWRQPLGAEDAYHRGDRVRYEGKFYVSTVEGNAHAPGVSGWEEIGA